MTDTDQKTTDLVSRDWNSELKLALSPSDRFMLVREMLSKGVVNPHQATKLLDVNDTEARKLLEVANDTNTRLVEEALRLKAEKATQLKTVIELIEMFKNQYAGTLELAQNGELVKSLQKLAIDLSMAIMAIDLSMAITAE